MDTLDPNVEPDREVGEEPKKPLALGALVRLEKVVRETDRHLWYNVTGSEQCDCAVDDVCTFGLADLCRPTELAREANDGGPVLICQRVCERVEDELDVCGMVSICWRSHTADFGECRPRLAVVHATERIERVPKAVGHLARLPQTFPEFGWCNRWIDEPGISRRGQRLGRRERDPCLVGVGRIVLVGKRRWEYVPVAVGRRDAVRDQPIEILLAAIEIGLGLGLVECFLVGEIGLGLGLVERFLIGEVLLDGFIAHLVVAGEILVGALGEDAVIVHVVIALGTARVLGEDLRADFTDDRNIVVLEVRPELFDRMY